MLLEIVAYGRMIACVLHDVLVDSRLRNSPLEPYRKVPNTVEPALQSTTPSNHCTNQDNVLCTCVSSFVLIAGQLTGGAAEGRGVVGGNFQFLVGLGCDRGHRGHAGGHSAVFEADIAGLDVLGG